MEPLIIAFTGAIGSGKSTLAEELKKSLLGSQIIPVARFVYDAAECVYEYLGFDFKKNRALLQAIGDIGRGEDEDFWINNTIYSIRRQKCKYAIVPDIRYPNEIRRLRETFKNVIHINLAGSFSAEETNHSSETSMNDFKDYDIIFNQSLYIPERVEHIMEAIIKLNLNK